jgi:TetR/AcrR family transcriptional regulator, transcriptional repressor for nem operon
MTSEPLVTIVIIALDDARHYNCQDPTRTRNLHMRVSKEQAAENRERILKAASHLMRERGISGAGVDALTEAAGMTHGSLYSQFGSKERLVEEALDYVIADSGQTMGKVSTLGGYVSAYLSAEHRDMPGRGCPLAALCGEMPRQSRGVRERFTAGLRGMIGQLSGRMGSRLKQRQRDEEALATIASLVGALVLARAVNDPTLSDDILRATKRRLWG